MFNVKVFRAWLTPLVAVFIAFAVGALLMFLQGAQPMDAYGSLFSHGFGSWEGFAKTLGKATPLMLSGLAVTIGLRSGLFNIGVQGQLVSGALAAGWAGYAIHGLPIYIHLPIALLFGIVFGALVG